MTFAATFGKVILWTVPVVFVLSTAELLLKSNGYPSLAAQVDGFSKYAEGFIACWWWKKYTGY